MLALRVRRLLLVKTLPFYERVIGGDLRKGKQVLVVAHGNSLRSIVMKLDALSPQQVAELEIPTGLPIEYELTPAGTVRSKHIRS